MNWSWSALLHVAAAAVVPHYHPDGRNWLTLREELFWLQKKGWHMPSPEWCSGHIGCLVPTAHSANWTMPQALVPCKRSQGPHPGWWQIFTSPWSHYGSCCISKTKMWGLLFFKVFFRLEEGDYFLKISKKPSVRARNRYDLCIWLLALLILLTAFRAVCLVFPSPSLFIKERWLDLLVVEIPGSHHLDTPQRFRLQQTNERKTSVFIQAF